MSGSGLHALARAERAAECSDAAVPAAGARGFRSRSFSSWSDSAVAGKVNTHAANCSSSGFRLTQRPQPRVHMRACVRIGTHDTARIYPPTHLHMCMYYISAHRLAGKPTARDRHTHTPHMDAMRVGLCRCVSACMCVHARAPVYQHASIAHIIISYIYA